MKQQSGPEFVHAEFERQFGASSGEWPRLYRAPGRINLIGEHTDYNGGLVFPSTIGLYTWVAARPREDGLLNFFDCTAQQGGCLDLARLEAGTRGAPVEYIKGVVWALQQDGLALQGCDVAISGNIPLGGGLSSSASLELAFATALLDCAGLDMDRKALALACQRAESEFVGAQCGIMDQYVIALGEAGKAMLLDCRSLEFQHVPIPPELNFLIVHSGVSHRVSTGSYNSRRQECDEALQRLQTAIPGLEFLADLKQETLLANRDLLGDVLFRRSRHVVEEIGRVREAVEALTQGNLARLGTLVNGSHASLRDDFEVSCTELDQLVDIAQAHDAVFGARMMGAGFGGCVLCLVSPQAASRAAADVSKAYGQVIGRKPWAQVTVPAAAVERIR